jgi:hypothetical protein
MMLPTLPRIRSVFVLLSILALLAGAVLLAYNQWSKPMIEAERAVQAGEPERALAEYAVSIGRFRERASTQQMLPDDYARVMHNRLALLYQTGQYDAVIDAAGTAPPAALPHFWVGCAMFSKAIQEEGAEGLLEWLSRAEDEFKLALAATPDDWDTKYNYELSARLAAELREPPKQGNRPQRMQLLRPQTTSKPREAMKKAG